MGKKCFKLCLTLLVAIFINNATANSNKQLKNYFKKNQYYEVTRRGISLDNLGFKENKDAKNLFLGFNSRIEFASMDQYEESQPENTSELTSIGLTLQQIEDDFNEVKNNRLFIAATKGQTINLPFGINKTIDGKEYIIVINKIELREGGAYATVSTIINDPRSGGVLAFGLKDLLLNSDGSFAADGTELVLLADYDMHFGNNIITFKGGENSVEFDCNGFKKLNLSAIATILPGIIEAEDLNHELTGQDVKANIVFTAGEDIVDFEDWIVTVTILDQFQFIDLPGFSFDVETAVLDFSVSNNSQNMTFPTGYDGSQYWEGFYLKNITVTLPPEIESYKTSGTTQTSSITIADAVIDKLGFTGKIFYQGNLISLNQGSMDGWDYSLTKIGVDIFKGTLRGAYFGGQIKLPVTEDDEVFDYDAKILLNREYRLTITTTDEIHFNILNNADVKLYEDSRFVFEFQQTENKFTAEAILNGNVSVSVSSIDLDVADITFQGLHIASRDRGNGYFFLDPNNGAFSVGSPAASKALAGFPVGITEIGLQTQNGETGLDFTIFVNLTGGDDAGGGFSGYGSFTIWFTQNPWEYDTTEINEIGLNNIKIAVLTLSGKITFFNNEATYGSGFSGNLDCEIEITEGSIAIEMGGIFGRVTQNDESFRYWAVDAAVSFTSKPIEIFPPFIYANKFGGGATYKMKANPTATGGYYATQSGMVYEPTSTVGLGLLASVGIQGARAEIYNGDVNLSIIFASKGVAISQITLSGFVQMLTLPEAITDITENINTYKAAVKSYIPDKKVAKEDPAKAETDTRDKLASMNNGAVLAKWFLDFNFENKTLNGQFSTYINIAGGIIKGVGDGGKSGTVDIHLSPSTWHLYVGKPNDPCGLAMLNGIIKSESYFVMGNDLGNVGLASKYPNLVSEPDKGFGFGSSFTLGDKGSGGGFYYDVELGLFYDVLLMNVKGKCCSERPNDTPIGIKGWYAMGQAGIHFKAEAGVDLSIPYPVARCCVKIRIKHKHIKESVSVSFDTKISFNAPNPTRIAYETEILGYDISVAWGDKCTI